MIDDYSTRLQHLEEKFEYQDQTIDALNSVIIDQQKQITALEEEVRRLETILLRIQEKHEGSSPADPPPPHY